VQAQIKRHHFTLLLVINGQTLQAVIAANGVPDVINEWIYEIFWFLEHMNCIKQHTKWKIKLAFTLQ